ncbi:MAG TPA: poly(R)-hydroxyalkanoic acid synthase subunit PhaE [Steroidobacteraceae bacterium]
MNDSSAASGAQPAFLRAWDDYAAACQTLFERFSDPAAGDPAANRGAAVPLAFFGAWQDFAKNLGMPSDPGGAAKPKPEELFARFLPALGHTREYQEIAQRMLDLGAQFQRRSAEFMQYGVDIGQRAMEALQKQSANDASVFSSTAAYYDAWIDNAEQSYAQTAHSEPFAVLLAQLCNIMSAFKVERGKLLEAFARQLDLPSRAEVDSLHRQVRELRVAARPLKSRTRKQRKSSDK